MNGYDYNFRVTREVNIKYGEVESKATIRIGGLQATEAPDWWICHWTIDIIHPEQGKIYGIDAMDALFNCMLFIQKLIRDHIKNGYEIWWETKGDNGGFSQHEARDAGSDITT